jgi:hypothetical protein
MQGAMISQSDLERRLSGLKQDGLIESWSLPIGTFGRPFIHVNVETDKQSPNFDKAAFDAARNKVQQALGAILFDLANAR